MPNQERVQMWLDALRSGEYERGKGFLEYNGKFCCLGVACDVAVKNGLEVEVKVVGDLGGNKTVSYNNRASMPPQDVAEWFGFETIDEMNGTPPGSKFTLDAWNDQHNRSFSRIANAIEKRDIKKVKGGTKAS